MKNTRVFGISARKQHGKDTVADLIIKIMAEEKKQEYVKRKFGDPLKQVAVILTGIPIEEWETEEDKNKFLGPEWDTYDQLGMKVPITRRRFLTKLGSDVMTKHFHKRSWINPTVRGVTESANVIFSDIRFFDELDIVTAKDGIKIRVSNPRVPTNETHPSERLMDDYQGWDFRILNDGSKEDLERKVRIILVQLGMI